MNYLYGAFLFISLILIYFANYYYLKTKKLVESGVKTTAKVVEMIPVSGDNGYTYKPVFEFYDKSGELQTFKSNVSSSPPAYTVDQKIKIIFNANDISEVKVVSYWGLYRATIILLTIAMPFLIIGAGYFLYINKSVEYIDKW